MCFFVILTANFWNNFIILQPPKILGHNFTELLLITSVTRIYIDQIFPMTFKVKFKGQRSNFTFFGLLNDPSDIAHSLCLNRDKNININNQTLYVLI